MSSGLLPPPARRPCETLGCKRGAKFTLRAFGKYRITHVCARHVSDELVKYKLILEKLT